MSLHPTTKAIRTQIKRTGEMEHSSPLFLTSSFTYDDAEMMRAAFADEIDVNIYSRFANPNVKEFVDRMVALEGAEDGYATSSGMSAIFAVFMALLKSGDHFVCSSSVFGSTISIINKYLPNYGIETTYVSATNLNEWESAI